MGMAEYWICFNYRESFPVELITKESQVSTVIVRTRKSRARVKLLIHSLPGILVGTHPDQQGIRGHFFADFTRRLMTKIHDGFLQKSDGNSDELGNTYKPLKPATIARRPITGKDPLSLSRRSRKGRGLLTKVQDERWNAIFRKMFIRFSGIMSTPEAKSRAAQIAWGVLKKSGAETKIDVLGKRKVPILVVSGRLERSLKPGRAATQSYVPPPDQIYNLETSQLEIGTSVPYAAKQHETRPLWPGNVSNWISESLAFAVEKFSRRVVRNF